ncbi:hydrogen peroxide-inducible genes activator [Jiella marina]|uniref:hydrogen peroxide-inducible genes activator n=1 Tax=Jiella sp. LLJ827 TaxID=2917712 RepID=UPI00210162B9|nr:hydrogen peroxide-inducible genes activator [Jiella sp. LLJ827]MCQ0989393.1 hydrogen peroxide-inducible genes activator [Jiella sp. LLJ827]
MLTLRQMRYFQALSETLHFGRAAKRLHISQPALSGQIAQMEEFFGTALFSRTSAGVALTSDGMMVGERVRSILAEVKELESLGDTGSALMGRRLRVGMIATVAPYLLPKLLPALSKEFPALECEIRESITERLVADLQSGEIDCAVVALPIGDADIETIPLFDDPFYLAVPAHEAVRLPNPVPASLLATERMILLEEGHCLRAQTMDVCRLADDHERAAFGATSLTTVLRMVAGGLGSTLIPAMAVEDENRSAGIAILAIEEPAPSRRLALAFRQTTVRLRDFRAFATVLCRAMGRDGPYLGQEGDPPRRTETSKAGKRGGDRSVAR